MAESEFIINVTESDFHQQVIENSHKQPVFVDFWAAWCGPCQSLMPLLAKLADEYQGKFIVAKVNSDEQQALAGEHGVRSLPTVKIFKHGREVDMFMGAQPEPVIRTIIETHIERESDQVRQASLAAVKQGENDKALELINKAIAMDPEREELKLDLAKVHFASGNADKAMQTIDALSFNLRNSAEAEKILAMVDFLQACDNAPDEATLEEHLQQQPDDLEARYQLGALKLLADDNEGALMQFLEIMQRDRKFRDDAGHKAILSVFRLLGDDHDIVRQYRRKMAMLLH